MRFLVVLLGLFALAVAALTAAEPAARSPESILLLRNGEMIRGHAVISGDTYDVTSTDVEIHVKSADVLLVCRDIQECYDHRRKALQAGSVEQHLDLAQWCMRNDLPAEGGQQLALAMQADASHPKVPLVERQLRLLLKEKRASPSGVPVSKPAGPSIDELDRLFRGLPSGAVETFTSSVQPVLLNRCATASCHGPGAPNGLHLLRVPAGRTSTRRVTQRNLHTVLALVDKERPEFSRLLTVPLEPHGNASTAIFTSREMTQYQQLVRWVLQVASSPGTDKPTTVNAAPQALLQTLEAARVQPGRSDKADSAEARNFGEPPADLPTAPPDPRLKQPASPRSEPQRGAKQETFEPRDEFDPEIFNRKYAPQQN